MPRLIAGVVRHYDWGDENILPDMLGVPRDGRPWAELWFGTHPQAPSHLDSAEGPLLADTAGEMSVLVKILACARPLSLQTHPDAVRAEAGFAREEAAGIPRDSGTRMYRDPFDKPEQVVALTRFDALCGFLPEATARERLERWGWHDEAGRLEMAGTRGYLEWAFDLEEPPPLDRCDPWMVELAAHHPHDPGLRAAALLNRVVLEPGESLALGAGNLHAYLRGTALEAMRTSDNVVRAGFTSKHVDVAELLSIVDTTPLADPVVRGVREGNLVRWSSPSPVFTVSALDWHGGDTLPASDRWRICFGEHGTVAGAREPSAILVAPGENCALGAASGGGGADRGRLWIVEENRG